MKVVRIGRWLGAISAMPQIKSLVSCIQWLPLRANAISLLPVRVRSRPRRGGGR
jgi:hypothetical protein